MSPVEKELLRTPDGVSQVQEYHRQLFHTSSAALHQEITAILAADVSHGQADVVPAEGRVVEVFPTGTLVLVFRLAGAKGPAAAANPSHSKQ